MFEGNRNRKNSIDVMEWFANWYDEKILMDEREKREEHYHRMEALDMILTVLIGVGVIAAMCGGFMLADSDYTTGIIVSALSLLLIGLCALVKNHI